MARHHHGRRARWAAGALVLICGVVWAAPPRTTGRREKRPKAAAEAPAESPPRAPTRPRTPLDGPQWRLQSYRGSDGEIVTPPDGSRPTIRFRDGRIITGSAGCNTFTAGYTYDAGKLTVSHPATTSKSCPEPAMTQEATYLAALHRVAGFTMSETTLTLEDAGGVALLTYEREPPPVLTGTEWRMTAYDAKGELVPARRDVAVTATFGPDGRVTGSAGCNEYRGPYTQTGEKLTIGTLIIMTRKACAAEIKDQERAYLAALRSATGAELGGDELLLTRADDARAVRFTASSAPAP